MKEVTDEMALDLMNRDSIRITDKLNEDKDKEAAGEEKTIQGPYLCLKSSRNSFPQTYSKIFDQIKEQVKDFKRITEIAWHLEDGYAQPRIKAIA